jgi:MinD superfamily P-loop ATPase
MSWAPLSGLNTEWSVTPTVVVDDRCTACGACLVTCPTRALVAAPFRPRVVDQRCTGCGECIEICPRGAISDATVTTGRRVPAGTVR